MRFRQSHYNFFKLNNENKQLFEKKNSKVKKEK
jgi:hypothetical protein